MTDRNRTMRRTARGLVALALLPLVLSTALSGLAALTRMPAAPSAPTPTPASPDGRYLFVPLDGSEDQGVLLSSRGGYVLPPSTPTPEAPTSTPEPTATPAPPTAADLAENDALGASLFADLLLTAWPEEKVAALPDYFVPDDAVLYVTSDTLNLRGSPGTDGAVLRKLKYADKVTRTAYGTDWSLVVASDGAAGYVKTDYLASKKPAPKVPPVSAADLLRARIVAYAKAQLGVKYVHYAASPTAGFDCSGLTWYVYKEAGISVPRSSIAYGTFGRSVKLSEIKPGDILCWDTFNDGVTRINHVSLYIGNGMMIHAAGGGKDVRYQKVSTYQESLLSVRRIIQ